MHVVRNRAVKICPFNQAINVNFYYPFLQFIFKVWYITWGRGLNRRLHSQLVQVSVWKGWFEKRKSCRKLCTHIKVGGRWGARSTHFHKMCWNGFLWNVHLFVCIRAWKGIIFIDTFHMIKGPFKFCQSSWLCNVSFKTPLGYVVNRSFIRSCLLRPHSILSRVCEFYVIIGGIQIQKCDTQ